VFFTFTFVDSMGKGIAREEVASVDGTRERASFLHVLVALINHKITTNFEIYFLIKSKFF
jgi:ABC-type maltose transport system permease subunit